MTDTTIELELETILEMQRHGFAEEVNGQWRATPSFDAFVAMHYADFIESEDKPYVAKGDTVEERVSDAFDYIEKRVEESKE